MFAHKVHRDTHIHFYEYTHVCIYIILTMCVYIDSSLNQSNFGPASKTHCVSTVQELNTAVGSGPKARPGQG